MSTFQDLSIVSVLPDPKQPRKYYDDVAMEELVASVKTHGVIQPILVRPDTDGFMIVAGERRYRASLSAGLETIPATIRNLTDEQALEIQITENLLRKDVHPLEEAVGFKSLYENLSIEQISNRVGKSQGFVAKRIKLAELVEDAQTIFFRGHMDLEQAQQLCRLAPDDQQAVLKEYLPKDWKTKKGDWHIGNIAWLINKKMVELKDAKFKTNDANLYPEAGACTKCPYNSANQPLLFDDMKGKHCTKPTCFAIKQQRAMKAKMEELAANPNLICVTSYIYSDEDKAKVAAAKEMGITILDDKMYESHYEVDAEWPTFEDWVQDNDDPEDEDYNEESARNEYAREKKIWEEDLAEQNAAIAEGRVIKAYIIAGNAEGEEKLIQLKSSAKAMVDQATGNGDDSATTYEIAQIEMREIRNKQLDGEKIWTAIRELIGSDEAEKVLFNTEPLSETEMLAVAHAIYDKINYSTRRKFEDQLGDINKSVAVTDIGLNVALRIFLLDVLVSAYGSHQVNGSKNAIAYQVIKKYLPTEIAQIEIQHQEKAEKRQANIAKRIAALRKQSEKAKELPAVAEDVLPEGNNLSDQVTDAFFNAAKAKSKRKAKAD
jgi:ParB family chromosome partitioning protein